MPARNVFAATEEDMPEIRALMHAPHSRRGVLLLDQRLRLRRDYATERTEQNKARTTTARRIQRKELS